MLFLSALGKEVFYSKSCCIFNCFLPFGHQRSAQWKYHGRRFWPHNPYWYVSVFIQLLDFGYILDISPGGINFESVPFKLTKEMLQLLGNSTDSPYYLEFKELCIKAFLSLRPYADEFVQVAALMLESGLPCFKYG